MKKALLLLAATGLLQAAENQGVTIAYLKDHQDLIPQVVDIWYSGQKNLPVKPTEGMTAALKEHCNIDKLKMCLIALENGEAIGMIRLVDVWTKDPETSPWIAAHPEITPWVCGLIIKESHRRRGIGHQLVNAVKENATKLGYNALYLGADDEYKEIYAKHNCQVIAETTFRGDPTTIMEYAIPQKTLTN